MRQRLLEAIDPKVLDEIVERLKAGASLLDESKALGYSHNGVLRAALRKHLGGVVQYDAMMMSGRTKPKKKGCSPVQAASPEGKDGICSVCGPVKGLVEEYLSDTEPGSEEA